MADFFNWILKSYGLNHIGTNIFSRLDFESLLNCQEVCEQWNQFIEENKPIWKQQLVKVQSLKMKNHLGRCRAHGKYFFNDDPILLRNKFRCFLPDAIEHYETKENHEIKTFIKFLYQFLEIDWSKKCLDNCEDFMLCSCQGLILYAIQTENVEVTNIFMEIQEYTSESELENMDLTVCYHTANGNISNLKFALLACQEMPFQKYGGKTALHYAFQNGKFKVIKTLLENAGPNLDINAENDKGCTALHLACNSGHCEVVKLLLAQGEKLDVNREDNNGCSPLHVACKTGSIKIVEELCKNPAIDVNAKDIDGNTPLHIGCNHINCKVVEILMKHPNIDLNARNDDGFTPPIEEVLERTTRSIRKRKSEIDWKTVVKNARKN